MGYFSDLVIAARVRQALDQGGLADRLDVAQQTVSRWERGQSSPQPAALARLAAALEVPEEDLLAAVRLDQAGKSRPSDTVAPPVQPRLNLLPFPQVAPDRFEDIVTDLLKRVYPDAAVNRLGGQGDTQHGYDILVVHRDGRRLGVQCKRESQFGPSKIRAAIAEATLEVDESAIALSRPATSAARVEMLQHPDWELWDQRDLSGQIQGLQLEHAIRVVDTHFPGYRESFLGIAVPGPWTTPEDFFADSPHNLLQHDQPLVGRDSVLDDIDDWVHDSSRPVGVLIGRGGLGKSKLLYEVCRSAEESRAVFRFLGLGQTPTPDTFEHLPAGHPLVLVVDDAHDVEDIAGIADQLSRHHPNAKLLLATRPYGVTLVDTAVRQLNLRPSAIARWELTDLEPKQSAVMVSSLINRPINDTVTQQLAAVSMDCPFIAVVGADLIQRGVISNTTVARSTELRTELLERFTERAIDQGPASETGERRATLQALAAFQPVRLGEPDFQAAMTALTGIPIWDIVSGRIRQLEDAGLVLRRGGSVRIVPDMLGDVVLGQASFDDRSKLPHTFLQRAQNAANGLVLQHLLLNASRMDWQMRDQGPASSELVGDLWPTLHDQVLSADHEGQLQLLQLLEETAFFQPDRALAIVTDLLAAERDDPQPSDEVALWESSQIDVVHAIPPVLRNIAYHLDHLPACLALLWPLACADKRAVSQNPDHSMRVLQGIAELQMGKPFAYIHAVIDAAETWLRESSGNSRPSPFDVLEPILATEGADETHASMAITFHPFGIDPNSVQEVRDRVIALAAAQARSGDPASAVVAVRMLENAIRYPIGMFNRTPGEEERAHWTPLFLPIIKQLGDLGSEPNHDPVVRLAVRQALDWHATYSTTETKAAARSAVERLVQSREDDLALCLRDGWGHFARREGVDYEAAEHALLAEFRRVAGALVADHTDDDDILDLVDRRIAIDRAAFGTDGNPSRFLWELLQARPSLATALCERALAGNADSLQSFVGLALSSLAEHGKVAAVELGSKLLDIGSVELSRIVAAGFSWNRGARQTLLDGELRLLARLGRHEDAPVRWAIGRAVFLIARSNPGAGLQLLSKIHFRDSGKVAAEALFSFIPQGPLTWEQVDQDLRASILHQLAACDSIDEYQLQTAIATLSAVEPVGVVKMLVQRIELQETRHHKAYEAIPYSWEPKLRVRETPYLADSMLFIRDWLATTDQSYNSQHVGARLYAIVAGSWDHQALAALEEPSTVDPQATMTAIAQIIGQAPSSILFDHADFVTRLLRRAEQLGSETAQAIVRAFVSTASSGVAVWRGDQPSPEDIELRDRATQLRSELSRGSIEERLYRTVSRAAEERIQWTIQRDERDLDRRD